MSQEDKVPVLGNGRDSGALEATFSPRLGQPFLSACSFLPGEKAGPVSPGLWFFFFQKKSEIQFINVKSLHVNVAPCRIQEANSCSQQQSFCHLSESPPILAQFPEAPAMPSSLQRLNLQKVAITFDQIAYT